MVRRRSKLDSLLEVPIKYVVPPLQASVQHTQAWECVNLLNLQPSIAHVTWKLQKLPTLPVVNKAESSIKTTPPAADVFRTLIIRALHVTIGLAPPVTSCFQRNDYSVYSAKLFNVPHYNWRVSRYFWLNGSGWSSEGRTHQSTSKITHFEGVRGSSIREVGMTTDGNLLG